MFQESRERFQALPDLAFLLVSFLVDGSVCLEVRHVAVDGEILSLLAFGQGTAIILQDLQLQLAVFRCIVDGDFHISEVVFGFVIPLDGEILSFMHPARRVPHHVLVHDAQGSWAGDASVLVVLLLGVQNLSWVG